jgi:hypothetical protein
MWHGLDRSQSRKAPTQTLLRELVQNWRMTSWRDSVSAQAQADMDELLSFVLPFAEEMLLKRGEFYPYGASIGADGQREMNAADPGLGEHPDSRAVLEALWEGLIEQKDSLRAVAVVSDIRLKEPEGDAIRIDIEHREGTPITVLRPYRRSRLGRGCRFDELVAQPGAKRIWR